MRDQQQEQQRHPMDAVIQLLVCSLFLECINSIGINHNGKSLPNYLKLISSLHKKKP